MALRATYSQDTNQGATDTIEIYDSEFVGTAIELQADYSRGGFTHKHRDISGEENGFLNPYQNKIMEGVLDFFPKIETADELSLFNDILGSDSFRFKVVWKQDSVIEWQGYIDTRSINYPEKSTYFFASIRARDFEILKGLYYTSTGAINGALLDGRDTIIKIFAEQLDYLDLGINIKSVTSFEVSGETGDYLNYVYKDKFAFRTYARTGDENDEPLTVYDALLRNLDGLILSQKGGVFYLEQITEYADASTSGTTTNVYTYNSSGVLQTTTLENAGQTVFNSLSSGSPIIKITSDNEDYPAIKTARIKFDHRSTISTFKFPSQITTSDSETFTTPFLSTGEQSFTISGTVVAISTENESDAEFEVQYKAGQYYWNGSIWTETVSNVTQTMFGSGIQDGDGNYIYRGFLSVETTNVPADLTSGLQITVFNAEILGSPPTAATSTTYNNFTFIINNEITAENSTFIDYQLTQANSFSTSLNLGDSFFGDGPAPYSRSALSLDDGGTDLTSNLFRRRGETVEQPYHQLVLREVLDAQRSRVRRLQAKFEGSYNITKIAIYDSSKFFYTGGSYVGVRGVRSATLYRVNIATSETDVFEVLPKFTADSATGSATTSGGSSGGGITQSFADARYLIKSLNLSDLTDASVARTNLGLGSLAVLNSINNTNWSGTDLAIVNGGTGASTVSAARTNFGLGTADDVTFNSLTVASLSGGVMTGTSIDVSGNSDANAFRINGTTVIDSGRNASFVGGTFTGIVRVDSATAAAIDIDGAGVGDSLLRFYHTGAVKSQLYYDVSTNSMRLLDNVNGNTVFNYVLGSSFVFSVNASFPQANIDNIRIDGNTISTTNTNGNLLLSPNGTGNTIFSTSIEAVGGSFSGSVIVSNTGAGISTGDNSLLLRLSGGAAQNGARILLGGSTSGIPSTGILRAGANTSVATWNATTFNINVESRYTELLRSSTFTLGSVGWRIENDGDGQLKDLTLLGDLSAVNGTFTTDLNVGRNLYVEGGLFAREFVVDTTRVMFNYRMSAGGGKISNVVVSTVGSEQISFEDEDGTLFTPVSLNDILHIQVRRGFSSGVIVKNIWRRVSAIASNVVTLTTSGIDWITANDVGVIEVGDDIVQEGNTADVDRDQYIQFDVSTQETPSIRFFDNATDVGVRDEVVTLGLLDGVATGASGIGLLTQRAFLTDSVLVGDLTKATSYLEFASGNLSIVAGSNLTISSADELIKVGASNEARLGKLLNLNASAGTGFKDDFAIYASTVDIFGLYLNNNNYFTFVDDDEGIVADTYALRAGTDTSYLAVNGTEGTILQGTVRNRFSDFVLNDNGIQLKSTDSALSGSALQWLNGSTQVGALYAGVDGMQLQIKDSANNDVVAILLDSVNDRIVNAIDARFNEQVFLNLVNLPTSDPSVAGQLYRDGSGQLFVSLESTPSAPATPTGLDTCIDISDALRISWTASAGTDVLYDVQRSLDDSTWSNFATNLTDTQTLDFAPFLNQSTTYYYRVRAKNDGGFSAYSASVSATYNTESACA